MKKLKGRPDIKPSGMGSRHRTGHAAGSARGQGRRELQADPALVAAAMANIPNADAHYNEWVRMAYAVAGAGAASYPT